MKKRILSAILTFSMVLALVPVMPVQAASSETDVVRYTVLILDTSGSMSGTPAEKQKIAAEVFCEALFEVGGINKVAIVRLDNPSKTAVDFKEKSKIADLRNYISSLPVNILVSGGTNTNGALKEAETLLSGVPDNGAIKNIVLCSDGLPAHGNYKDDRSKVHDDGSEAYTTPSAYSEFANAAYNTAQRLKDDYNYNIYTLGFFHSLNENSDEFKLGEKFMQDVATSPDYYYQVTDPDTLEFRFGEIAQDIVDEKPKEIPFTYTGTYVDMNIGKLEKKYFTLKEDEETKESKLELDEKKIKGLTEEQIEKLQDLKTRIEDLKYKTYNENCYYTDSYFSKSSYEYQQSLGTMSLVLAMSTIGNGADNVYENKSSRTKNLLESLGSEEGFAEIEANVGFRTQPTTDSIGVVVGHKKIQVSDTEYQLIAVAIRSGDYRQEWTGNFTLGRDGQHQGFKAAKDQVLKFLIGYIVQKEITGPVKIWITGFSRGAATTNLVSGAIDSATDESGAISFEKMMESEGISFNDEDYKNYVDEEETVKGDFTEMKPKLGDKAVGEYIDEKISCKLEDVYAYCFETPMGALENEVKDVYKDAYIYRNIFNIVNLNDPVPYVAMTGLGFTRYGRNIYLPSAETKESYYTLSKNMLEKYNNLACISKGKKDDDGEWVEWGEWHLKLVDPSYKLPNGNKFAEEDSPYLVDSFQMKKINWQLLIIRYSEFVELGVMGNISPDIVFDIVFRLIENLKDRLKDNPDAQMKIDEIIDEMINKLVDELEVNDETKDVVKALIKCLITTLDITAEVYRNSFKMVIDDIKNNLTQSGFLSNYMGFLSDIIRSRNDFVDNYQDTVRLIITMTLGGGFTEKQSEIFYDKFFQGLEDEWYKIMLLITPFIAVPELTAVPKLNSFVVSQVTNVILDCLSKAFTEAGITYEPQSLKEAAVKIAGLAVKVVITHPNYLTTVLFNAEGVFSAHYPELCFAWMASMDPNYSGKNPVSFNNGAFRVMRINSKVNVEVRNENDDLVAAIVDETPQDIEGSSIISSINEDGEKIVILPADATYDVSITGREDDTVNYGISEYCASAGEYTRVVNYFDIPLAEGQSLSAEIPAYSAEELDDSAQLEEGSDTVYTLVSANNIVLPSSSDMSGEEATDAYYSVTATSSNTAYGMAYGSGTRQYGSFAQLEAIPSENCEFLGWYAGKTLVSSDAQYRVRVTEDMELEARFAVQQGCYEVTFDANGGMPENTVRISDETGKLSSLPMVMRENYLFDGWFTDATDGAEISADTVFTRSMTVYAHWSDGDAATSGTCGEALTWTLDEAGTLTISGTGDMTDWSDAAGTPWYAFHDSIETVVIENGVTSIGEYAFNDYVVRIEVYYNGTEAQWSEVRIGANNESLREANFHFQENNTATPQLVVESKTAKAGETVVVNVSIRNNPGIMTFNLGFDHDSGLTLQSVQKAEGLEGFFNYDQTAVYLQNADITEDCDLLTLTFEVAPDAEGDQRVTISSVDASNQNEETVTFEVIDGSVTVKNHIPGDINGDKAVNLLDLVRFIKRLSGELVTVVTDALDVNGDGKVTIQDLVRLLKYLSGEDVEIF